MDLPGREQSNTNLRELALFAGIGGGILGGMLSGWETIAAVEIDAYARSVLLARQRDGCLPRFPIWDDVRTFNGKPWRGKIDIISGGFPCQDISVSGKGRGLEGKRSSLWFQMARIIREIQPRYIWLENSPILIVRGIERVLWDIASLGYDARWGVVGANYVGAPHKRERIWIQGELANPKSQRSECGTVQAGNRAESLLTRNSSNSAITTSVVPCDAATTRFLSEAGMQKKSVRTSGDYSDWWQTEPDVGRVVDGVPHRLDRLRTLGNAQVPEVAKTAWGILTQHAKACLK